MTLPVRTNSRRAASVACAPKLAPRMTAERVVGWLLTLALAGCSPSPEGPNPWANFVPTPAQPAATWSSATGTALAEPVGGRPNAPITALSVRLNDMPQVDLNRSPIGFAPPAPRKTEYPPPAPPAEDSDSWVPTDGNPDVSSHWTGAIIYSQPGCVPCAMEIRDLRKAGWKCGVRDGSHFKIVELLTLADFEVRGVPSTPQTAYFVDGTEQPPRITGYGGTNSELAAIVNRHPRVRRRLATTRPAERCTCLAGSDCICHGNCPCAAAIPQASSSCSGSPAWYEAVRSDCSTPVVACNSPTSYPMPLHVAANGYQHSVAAIGPATHSAQLSLFGFPLIGGSVGTSLNW
jgi:hypothetical protein